jgi:hypothetical protein
MIGWNPILKAEFIEQTVPTTNRLAHHRPDPVADSISNRESRPAEPLQGLFQHPQPICDNPIGHH